MPEGAGVSFLIVDFPFFYVLSSYLTYVTKGDQKGRKTVIQGVIAWVGKCKLSSPLEELSNQRMGSAIYPSPLL